MTDAEVIPMAPDGADDDLLLTPADDDDEMAEQIRYDDEPVAAAESADPEYEAPESAPDPVAGPITPELKKKLYKKLLDDERLKAKIIEYFEAFPDKLGELDRDLDTMNTDQLEYFAEQCSIRVGMKSNTRMIQAAAVYGIITMEQLVKAVGVKSDGFANLCMASKDIQDLLKEFSLKHSTSLSSSVEVRIAMSLAGVLMQVDKLNRRREQLREKATASKSKQPSSAPKPSPSSKPKPKPKPSPKKHTPKPPSPKPKPIARDNVSAKQAITEDEEFERELDELLE